MQVTHTGLDHGRLQRKRSLSLVTVSPSPCSFGRDRKLPTAHRCVARGARGGETASHARARTANVTRHACHLRALRARRDIHVA